MSRTVIVVSIVLLAACICLGVVVVLFAAGMAAYLAASPAISPPLGAVTPTPIATQTGDEMGAAMDAIEQQVKDLRGWESSGPVPRNFYTEDQIRDYNLESFQKDYSPEEAADDVVSLVAFGLLDPAFDLYTFYIDLYSEGILGMYDPDVAELFIITERNALGAVERSTFAHEYLHALQDQNHGFEALGWNDEAFDADSQRFGALQALIEGEATLLEYQWQDRYFTPSDWDDYNQNAYADPDSAVFRAPDWLQDDFYFPYIQGYEFVNQLYERGGWAGVDAAYDRLPISTEHILHPDKYDDYELPVEVSAPPLVEALGPEWRVADTNNMGEWYTHLILRQYLDERDALEAAAGWGGDRYTVAYNDSTGQVVAAWHLVWDSPAEAEEFVDAFQQYGDNRFGVAASLGDGRLCWETGKDDSCLFFTSNATLWVLGPDMATLETVRASTDF